MVSIQREGIGVFITALSLVISAGCTAGGLSDNNNNEQNRQKLVQPWAIKLIPGTNPEFLSNNNKVEFLGQIGSLKDTYLIKLRIMAVLGQLKADKRIVWMKKQVPRHRAKKPENVNDITK